MQVNVNQPTTPTPGHELKQDDYFVVGPNVFKVLTPPLSPETSGSALLVVGKAINQNYQLWGYNNYNKLPDNTEVQRDVPAQVVAGMTTTGSSVVGREAEPAGPAESETPATAAEVLATQSLEPNALDFLAKAAAKPNPVPTVPSASAPKPKAGR